MAVMHADIDDVAPAEREPCVHAFFRRFFETPAPVGVRHRTLADHLRPLLPDIVRSRGMTAFGANAAVARLVDELYDAGTPDSLAAMLAHAPCDAVLLYAVRKFPLPEQPRAVEILREQRVRPIALRTLGAAFYHPDVVRWMLEGYVDALCDRPETLAGLDREPTTLADSPLLRSMDAIYQMHRGGQMDRAELARWWTRILRALRPVVDRLSPVDAFFVDQGDPAGLVFAALALLRETDPHG